MASTEREIWSATVWRTQQPRWEYPKRVSMTICSNCVLARSMDLTFKSTVMIKLAFSVATSRNRNRRARKLRAAKPRIPACLRSDVALKDFLLPTVLNGNLYLSFKTFCINIFIYFLHSSHHAKQSDKSHFNIKFCWASHHCLDFQPFVMVVR
jgi:hypothetical protein